MHVAIDASPAMKAQRTGVARYVENLVRGLAEVARDDDTFRLATRMSLWRRRSHRLRPPDARFEPQWFQGRLGVGRADITHGPDGRLLWARGARRVVTIHDVFALETEGEGTDAWREKMRARYRRVAARADLVLFLSAWSRDRFLHHHPKFEASRGRVIPPGVESRFRPGAIADALTVRERLAVDGPYALFLGALVKRKNPDTLLEAWARLPGDAPMLLLAGPDAGRRDELEAAVLRHGLGGRVRLLGWVQDDDVPPLLAGAQMLVLPSTMEGYGLPVLEAMACGTPVVHSGRGALPEAAGDAGLVADPDDADAIAGACRRVLEDDALRERMRSEGLRHASRFTWSETARRTMEAYRGVL